MLLHTEQSDDHVSHLHAGIVDVVLDLHALARVPENPHHRVAEHGVAHVSDVRGLVGINAGMFDDDFLMPAVRWSLRAALRALPECSSVEVCIQVTAARHFHARDSFDLCQTGSNVLGNLTRCFFESLRQLKAHRGRRLAHFELRRTLQHNLERHSILLPYVRRQRFAQSNRQFLIHASSR